MSENIQEGSGETDCLGEDGQAEISYATNQEIAGQGGYTGCDEKSESGVAITSEMVDEQNITGKDKVTETGNVRGCKRKTDDSTEEQSTQNYMKCLVVGPSQELIEFLIPVQSIVALNLTSPAQIQRQIVELKGANDELKRNIFNFQRLFRDKKRLTSVARRIHPSIIFADTKRR